MSEVSRDYDVLVAEGRAAAASQWHLGDLAGEVEVGYGEESLQRYAEEIGVEYRSLETYRTVARAYEIPIRIGNLSWSVHKIFASQPDRHELIQSQDWTVRAARKLVRARKREQEPQGFDDLQSDLSDAEADDANCGPESCELRFVPMQLAIVEEDLDLIFQREEVSLDDIEALRKFMVRITRKIAKLERKLK